MTSSTSNTEAVTVNIRVFDDDAGSTLVGITLPDKDVPLLIPDPRGGGLGKLSKLSGALGKLGGVPIHLYAQPSVAFTLKGSAGTSFLPAEAAGGLEYRIFAPPQLAGAAPATQNMAVSVEDFTFRGAGAVTASRPRVPDHPFDPRVDIADPVTGDRLPVTDPRAFVITTLGKALETSLTFQTPASVPFYLGGTGTLALKLKIAGAPREFVPWALKRVAVTAAAAAVSGGTLGAAVGAATTSAFVGKVVTNATEIAQYTARAYQLTFDAKLIYDNLSGTVGLLVQQVLPQLTAGAKALVAVIVKVPGAVVGQVKAVAGKAKDKIKGLAGFRAAQLTQAAEYRSGKRLSARPLRSARGLRPGRITAARARAVVGLVNRYAPSSPVRLRKLLVAGRLRPGGRVRVAAYARRPKGTPDGASVLTLTGPKGAVYEALVDNRGGVAGATVTLPRKLPAGRWQLAAADYARSPQAGAPVAIALTEFVVSPRG